MSDRSLLEARLDRSPRTQFIIVRYEHSDMVSGGIPAPTFCSKRGLGGEGGEMARKTAR